MEELWKTNLPFVAIYLRASQKKHKTIHHQCFSKKSMHSLPPCLCPPDFIIYYKCLISMKNGAVISIAFCMSELVFQVIGRILDTRSLSILILY
jgi:hypothetical protein